MKKIRNWFAYRVLETLMRRFNRVRQAVFGPVTLTRKDLRTMVGIADRIIADNPYVEKCYWIYAELISQTHRSGSGEYENMQYEFHTFYKVSDYFPWMHRGNLMQLHFRGSVSNMDEMMQSKEFFSEYRDETIEVLALEFVPVLIEKYRRHAFSTYSEAIFSDENPEFAEVDGAIMGVEYAESLKSDKKETSDDSESE